MKPILYSGTKNASSWAMRAWLALKAAGIEFDEVDVDIRRPQRFANLEAVGRLAPSATVPTLVVEGEAIFDSLAIMEFANDLSGGKLLPSDPVSRASARSILAWQHTGLGHATPSIFFESAFYPDRRSLTDEELRECERLMDHFEKCLTANGGPFLFGKCSLADFAVAPTVLKYDRHGFPWSRWPSLPAWAHAVLEHPIVADWVAQADMLPHIWDQLYLTEPEKSLSAETAWVARPKSWPGPNDSLICSERP